jgi:pimeloyl-ACP methyl ester carboxylesterase
MMERHKAIYGRMPRQAAFDGGFASKENLRAIKELGVKDVSFSKRRGLEVLDMVKSHWVYRKLRNFRAGIVRDLVRSLDLRDVTIMGHDWGGPIGMRVAVDELPRLRALVMGNTWYWPLDSWQAKSFAYFVSMAPVQSMILDKNMYVERVMPLGVKHRLADEVMTQYREALPTPKSRIGVAELGRQLVEASDWLADLEVDALAALGNVPLLLTWGLHDLAFPRRSMERFREDFRLARVHRLDAKHYIQEDAPAEIASAIEGFLGSLDGPGGQAASTGGAEPSR